MKLLSTKIFIGYFIIIVLLTSLILFFSVDSYRQSYLQANVKELQNINNLIEPTLLPYLSNKHYNQLDSLVKVISGKSHTRITVILLDGVVVADSKRNIIDLDNHKNRKEIIDAISKGYGESIRYSVSVDKEMLYVAKLLKYNENNVAVLRTSFYVSDIEAIISKLQLNVLEAAVIVFIMSIIGVIIFSYKITKPVNRLSAAARDISLGNFDIQVEVGGKDELSELADNFNNMTIKLKKLFEKVKIQSEELNVIISSMNEGFAIVSSKGDIVLANHSFYKIIGSKNPTGAKIKNFIEDSQFLKALKDTKSKRDGFVQELEINEKYYLASCNYNAPKDEIIVLLSDITEMKKLEHYKKDFISNVSHELRTPLTAIKGFIETLKEEIEDDENRRYLEIINKHTDRLVLIVNDLLTLSELENPSSNLVLTEVDLKQLIESNVRIFEQKCAAKNLFIKLELDDNVPNILADSYRMEQVIINLIDNAIKYTDTGGVTISLNAGEKNVILSVIDSGIGIPKQDIKRVFERFYLVDKSRSRKVGGTGLGLSIVKHIILNHQGEIITQSEVGKGTIFKILLPIKNKKFENVKVS